MKPETEAKAEELIDWKPVARRLNLKERSFWNTVHKEGLPYYRLNSKVIRFKMSEVEQWLANRRVGVPC